MRPMHIDQIAGAMVQFAFRSGDKWLRRGTILSREQLARMPANNRNSLLDKGFIYAWPKEAGSIITKPTRHKVGKTERFVISCGFRGKAKYDVIEGHRINDEPLTKEAAMALAAE